MAVKRLPNELVDSILDHLYFDTETLRKCALVGRAWVRSSQRGIFRQIALQSPPSSSMSEAQWDSMKTYLKTTRNLIATFTDKPDLASYVQSLTLEEFQGDSSTDAQIDTATANVVQSLSNVESVTLIFTFWGPLSPFLKAALTNIFMAPSLTHVSLLSVQFSSFAELVSLLSHMFHLKKLVVKLYPLDLPDQSASGPSMCAPRSIQLNQLTLRGDFHPLISWFKELSCPFEMQKLQLFSLEADDLEYPEMIDLIQYVGKNLDELHFGRVQHLRPQDRADYLKYTPNLCILHLKDLFVSDTYTSSGPPVPVLEALFTPLLNQDGKQFPLRRLIIDLHIYHHRPSDSTLWDPWASFDMLLQRPEFALLEIVQFKLLPPALGKLKSSTVELLCAKLPLLQGSGKLVVEIVDDLV